MTVSLITLGTLSDSQLAKTIRLSLDFASQLVDEWIFVFYHQLEIDNFSSYLSNHSLSLDRFSLVLLSCCHGISASLNLAVSYVSCSWILILHSGDALRSLPPRYYSQISSILLASSTSDILIFGTRYISNGSVVGYSGHSNRRLFFDKFIPWVPHESTFIPRDFHKQNLYDVNLTSAMDYDFFLRAFTSSSIYIKTFPLYITDFSSGGTSSNILRSCLDVRHSFYRRIQLRPAIFMYVLSWLFFVYVFLRKHLFIQLSSFGRVYFK